jgi:rsbT antagonist protein RsbS
MDASQLPRVTLNLMRGCLVATLQFDLNRTVLEQFRSDLLDKLAAVRAKQVILDCSGVEMLDAEDFDALRRTIAMAALMGTKTVLAGLQPGVVSALIDLNVDVDGLETVLSLDDAFRLLEIESDPAPLPLEETELEEGANGEDDTDDPPE